MASDARWKELPNEYTLGFNSTLASKTGVSDKCHTDPQDDPFAYASLSIFELNNGFEGF
jgi:hypothetical protein